MSEKKVAKTAHDKDRAVTKKHACRVCLNETKVIKYLGMGPIHGLYWTCASCGFSESTGHAKRVAVVTDQGIRVCSGLVEAQKICLKKS